MEDSYKIKMPSPGMDKHELEEVAGAFGIAGNDLDLLTRSMVHLMAEQYYESLVFSTQVMPQKPGHHPVPSEISQAAARDAYLKALVRAKPLYEQMAKTIEGTVEGSQTIKAYIEAVRRLTEEDAW